MHSDYPVMGFVGAGRVGFTLGRYFSENGLKVSGYYSKTTDHALEASHFTKSKCYDNLATLIKESDIIFITVNDTQIENVYNECLTTDISNKILCHCSGALSSAVFSGIENYRATGYSVHPIFAVSDKYNSYKDIRKAYFTIEGSNERIGVLTDIFNRLGNETQVIKGEDKSKYHAAAVCASNLVIGLFDMSTNLLCECGFTKEGATKALMPLFYNNASNVNESGVTASLTGPVDRNDVCTVIKHLSVLQGDVKEVYRLLSTQLVAIAKEKYGETDYKELENVLKETTL